MVDVNVAHGKYVLAVSGGVDSVVLLDILRQKVGVELIVAHINHGIRPDSGNDEHFVQAIAKSHNLIFISTKLNLPTHASEATARDARYDFLRQCCKKFKADAIITAHHQDDVIETAIIAIIRGTGWRGLTPLAVRPGLVRPLLDVPKQALIGYARAYGLSWHEDATNTDESYLRNYVRHSLIPTLNQRSVKWQESFLQLIRNQYIVRKEVDSLLRGVGNSISRYSLIMSPEPVAVELLRAMLRNRTGVSMVQSLANSVLLFTKTASPHKIMPVNKSWQFRVTLRDLIVEPRVDVIR